MLCRSNFPRFYFRTIDSSKAKRKTPMKREKTIKFSFASVSLKSLPHLLITCTTCFFLYKLAPSLLPFFAFKLTSLIFCFIFSPQSPFFYSFLTLNEFISSKLCKWRTISCYPTRKCNFSSLLTPFFSNFLSGLFTGNSSCSIEFQKVKFCFPTIPSFLESSRFVSKFTSQTCGLSSSKVKGN